LKDLDDLKNHLSLKNIEEDKWGCNICSPS